MKQRLFRIALPLVVWLGAELAPAGGLVHVGVARGTSPGATCLEPLGPDQAELFARDPRVNSGGDDSFSIDGAANSVAVNWDAATGAWHAVGSDVLAVAITHYPRETVAPMTEHHGMVLLDSEDPAGDAFLEVNRAVEIPVPIVRSSPGVNEISWPPLPITGTDGACQLAGEIASPVIIGWNVYRLLRSVLPPGFSVPEHYLLGPDLDGFTVDDNGFVAHVANSPSTVDGLVHFSDTALSLDPAQSDFVYVIQPVWSGSPTGDADGDTIPDEDLNNDGIPEFIDPSGTGRGFTGRVDEPGGFRKPILVSTDSFTSRDVLMFIRKGAGAAHVVEWNAVGASAAPLGLDFHAGMLSDVRDPAAFAARDRLACGWPDGPGTQPLVDPRFAAGNRYYLLSVAWSMSGGRIVEEYGLNSFGAERPATTTPPPCR